MRQRWLAASATIAAASVLGFAHAAETITIDTKFAGRN
jgi:hypothetical protein